MTLTVESTIDRAPVLPSWGSAPAILAGDQLLSHDDLAARAAQAAQPWGPARRLVLIEFANDLASVTAYLAALNHGHVALVVPSERPTQRDALIAAYNPDILCLTGAVSQVKRSESAHDLHPELALLLSTSGSSGSPKLVRLSAANVTSNARAIADYQRLQPDDRAITSLPLHYCFGLSILHSHLIAGASVVLTDFSVVDQCFWELARATGVTTLSGVPYTFDLLESVGQPQHDLPTLRRLAQAGGRLEPSRVRALAQQAEAAGHDFFVMYGQTEATARMAYLPPELAERYPHCVGVPIPGGRFRVERVDEASEPDVGELIYEGPNVMMGYAETLPDLALPAGPAVLRTGDLARECDGLIQIVGRRSRIAKLFGIRVDLDPLERSLAAEGITARSIATDHAVHLFLPHGRHLEQARRLASVSCGVPLTSVQAQLMQSTPLTASGKVDHAALRTWAEDAEAEQALTAEAAEQASSHLDRHTRLTRTFEQVLGRTGVRPHDSFVGLGGDSLNYVELCTRLEQILPGGLPAGWQKLSIETLVAAPAAAPDRRPTVQPSRRRARLDTAVVLRAVAIVLIVASHADVIAVMGGAHLLLALAGYNFVRFQLAAPQRSTRVRRTLATMTAIAVPCSVWIAGVAIVDGRYRWTTALYLHQVTGATGWSTDREFWFLDALLLSLAAAAAGLTSRRLNQFENDRPWLFAVLVTAGCVALRLALVGVSSDEIERYLAPVVLMFFALGWLVARADTTLRRWVASAVVIASVLGFFGDAQRELVVIAGLLLTLWLPTLPLPGKLVRPIGTVAGASLGIYLTHWLVYPPLEDAGLGLLAVLASLAVGIGYTAMTRPATQGLSRVTHALLHSELSRPGVVPHPDLARRGAE